jgi:HAMP domain-containing protein
MYRIKFTLLKLTGLRNAAFLLEFYFIVSGFICNIVDRIRASAYQVSDGQMSGVIEAPNLPLFAIKLLRMLT